MGGAAQDELVFTELQTLVYIAPAPAPAPTTTTTSPGKKTQQPSSGKSSSSESTRLGQLTATPTMLFRYSALTFNGHRIHYDETYATQEEGYPGLVVHGPLLATAMVNTGLENLAPHATLKTLSWRALSPVFCPTTVTL